MLLEIWIFLSFIVAIHGRKTYLGFWGTFIFSLFFSPIVVLIYVLLSKRIKSKDLKTIS
jgi:hypothetical protein